MSEPATEPAVFTPTDYTEGQKVWVPHDTDAWDAAEVYSVAEDGKSLTLKAASDQEFVVLIAAPKPQIGIIATTEDGAGKRKYDGIAFLPLRDPLAARSNDLTTLSFLDEASILHNLRRRFVEQEIYTYTGPILVAVNPWRAVPELYDDRTIARYADCESDQLGELAPHIYAHGSMAYRQMLETKKSQCILVSGESGAGKTETCKILLRYLTLISTRKDGKNFALNVNVEKKLLETNPIMESLGNARTMHNPNSSRFGKFIEIQFDTVGRVAGAKIETYLLERSRVANLGDGDRNFHIFYQMLAGLEEEKLEQFGLKRDPKEYAYLVRGVDLGQKDDKKDFFEMADAMDILGMSAYEKNSVMETIAMVLRLGNVTFIDGEGDTKGKQIINPECQENLEMICMILGLNVGTVGTAMTQRTMVVRGDATVVTYTRSQALDARDAVARYLYSNLFNWVVTRINAAIHCEGASQATISLLDIFGFESMTINSFEQLCINYANEKLQQFFNNHIFKQEQKAYTDDHIAWTMVEFTDNMTVLDLIEGKPGMLSILDEQCLVAHGSDQQFLDNIMDTLRENSHLKRKRLNNEAWVVEHYAGDVTYEPWGFLEKNRDQMTDELTACITGAENKFLKGLFFKSEYHREQAASRASMRIDSASFKDLSAALADTKKGGRAAAPRSAKDMAQRRAGGGAKPPSGAFDPRSARSGSGNRRGKRGGKGPSALQVTTIGGRFKGQLAQLMSKLSQCYPFFIRCIKPNEVQKPEIWSGVDVSRQLRSGGVVDAVKITRSMYPNHIDQALFYKAYTTEHGWQCLLEKACGAPGQFAPLNEDFTLKQTRARCEALVNALGLVEGDEYQLGRSKIFFRAGVTARLDQQLLDYEANSQARIRAAYLRWKHMKQYKETRKATLLLQRVGRGMIARREYKSKRQEEAAIKIQRWFRTCRVRGVWETAIYLLKKRKLIEEHQRREEEKRQTSALKIQRSFKMAKAARDYNTLRKGIVQLQAAWRGKKVRKDNKIRRGGQLLNEKRKLERLVEEWSQRCQQAEEDKLREEERGVRLETQITDLKEQKDNKEQELEQTRQKLSEEIRNKVSLEGKVEQLEASAVAAAEAMAAEKSRLEEEVRFAKNEIAQQKENLQMIASFKEGADQHGAQLAGILAMLRGQLRTLRAQAEHDATTMRLQVEQEKAEMTQMMGEKLGEMKDKILQAWAETERVEEVLAETEQELEDWQNRHDRMILELERAEKALFSERMITSSLRNDIKKLNEQLASEKVKVNAGHTLYRQLEREYHEAIRESAYERSIEHVSGAVPIQNFRGGRRRVAALRGPAIDPRAGRLERLELDVETLAAHSSSSEVKAGFLMSDSGRHKKGLFKGKQWQKMWCVMDSTTFSLYKDVTSKEVVASIPLVSCTISFVEDAEEHKALAKAKDIRDIQQVFLVTDESGKEKEARTFLFYDTNTADTNDWVHGLGETRAQLMQIREVVKLASNGIDPRLAQFLIDEHLPVLDLAHSARNEQAAKCLALALTMRPQSLHTLSLVDAKLNSDEITLIANSVKATPTLTALDFSGNPCGDLGIQEMSKALVARKKRMTIHSLAVARCEFGDIGLSWIAQVVASCPQLSHLDLHGNTIGDNGVQMFVDSLKNTAWWTQERATVPPKEEIDAIVARKTAGEDPVSKEPPTREYYLKELNLSHNKIKDAVAVSAMLSETDIVREILISSNEIEDEGANRLAAALKSNNVTLASLDVGSNPIGTEGAASLMGMLRDNHALLYADFSELTVDGKKLGEHLALMSRYTHVTCKSLKLERAAASAE